MSPLMRADRSGELGQALLTTTLVHYHHSMADSIIANAIDTQIRSGKFADVWLNRRFWTTAAVVFCLVALFRGLRLPNQFSSTLVLFDYHFGFIKRGLIGATFGSIFHLERFTFFCAFSYTFIALLCLLMGVLIHQSDAFRLIGEGEFIAFFAGSYAVTYLGHLAGYSDIILAVITTGLLLFRSAHWRFIASVPLCILALLSHEMFLVVFFPAILLSFAFDSRSPANRSASSLLPSIYPLILSLFMVAGTLRLALHPALSAAQVSVMATRAASRADHVISSHILTLFQLSAGDNMRIMGELFLHDHRFLLLWFVSFATFGLTSIPLVAVSVMALKTRGHRSAPRLLSAGVICSSLSPLAMNLVGFDFVRWNALATLTSFLVLLTVTRGGLRVRLPAPLKNLVILLIACNMACGEGLMDRATPHFFPFAESSMHLVHSIAEEGGRMPVPE